MNEIIINLRKTFLDARDDQRNLKGRSLITAAVRKIARDHYRQINRLPKDDIFDLCEQLLDSGVWDERTVAFEWAFRARKQYTTNDFARFERWLDRYVDGWSSCDDFCTHAFGDLIFKFPEHIPRIKTWTNSKACWFRRAAAVVMIYGIRRERRFGDSIEIADLLLEDEQDLVQKGYGWMLKEISNKDPETVFEFVMLRKERMPRTALRYAVEKLSPELRRQAMER
jgi:3-methyladenine DNA glycosylase AlkD